MANTTIGLSGLADRYATALENLADRRQLVEAIAEDLHGLKQAIDGIADLRRLIDSPVITRAEQGAAMAAVLENAGALPLTRQFVGLIAQNRRLFLLPRIIARFLDRLAERRGEIVAEVRAARPLSDAQHDRLTEALRRALGAKVKLEVRTDGTLLGGLVVRVGSRLIDASLASKLTRLEHAMKGTA